MGIICAVLAIIGMGMGDFVSGLVAKKIGSRLSLVIIYSFQTMASGIIAIAFNKFGLDINLILIAAIAGIFQMFGLKYFFQAMKEGNISIASPIFALSSLITIGYGLAVLREPVSIGIMALLAFILMGTILVSIDSWSDLKKFNLKNKTVATAFKGAIIFGIALLLFTIAMKGNNFYGYNTIFAASTLVCSVIFLDKSKIRSIKSGFVSCGYLALTVGICYSLGNIFYGESINLIPTAIAAGILNAFPLVTVIASLMILKEKITVHQTIGIFMIVGPLVMLPLL